MPFRTSKGTFNERKGIIATFTANHFTAFGEIAPLPSFSTESFDEAFNILQQEFTAIDEALKELDSFPDYFDRFQKQYPLPSLIFGIDTLYHDLISKANHTILAETLTNKQSEIASQINVNTTIGISSVEKAMSDVTRAVKNGYHTVKLKVGLHFDLELKIIRTIRQFFPDVSIRIDANQSWNTQEAITNLNKLEELEIEYCEEPLQQKYINDWNVVAEQTNIPLAVDESFRSLDDLNTIINSRKVDVFVLKPMLFGRFSAIKSAIQFLQQKKLKIVITTSIESIIGRTVCGVFASTVGKTDIAHGLSTAKLLSQDLSSDIEIKAGKYILNNNSGIGRTINFNELTKII